MECPIEEGEREYKKNSMPSVWGSELIVTPVIVLEF